ncbi:MAG: TonB-dependent receptor [Magnetococcales bacterium]|nr:TonB-dependent receptor [Magnetococcales bacterium]
MKFAGESIRTGRAVLGALLMMVVLQPNGWASPTEEWQAEEDLEKLLDIGFEALAEITLTTAARKEQRLVDTSSAVYVVGQEEIRRSGMTSLPELLRLVPGLQVARINNDTWAITSRGFNAQYSNKLLILMDGRTLYNPLFAGVFWNVQDILLETIDRIEVIRGPGGSLWGANAVNGVINIITKEASETQGGRVTLATGNVDKVLGGFRYGGPMGKDSAFRVYAKGSDRNHFDLTSSTDSGDAWNSVRGGFRADLNLTPTRTLTLQGDLYQQEMDSSQEDSHGGNLQIRLSQILSETSNLSVQVYYDRAVRTGNEDRDTVDIDFQHRFSPREDHELIWGVGYRTTRDKMVNSQSVSWSPTDTNDETFSFFAQDEISFWDKSLRLTLGAKVEKNDYTGWEYQPNARILWHVDEKHAVWGSISRAVRSPSRADRDIFISSATGPNSAIHVIGNPKTRSETLLAYEVGYRSQPHPNVFLDIAAFYNEYKNLISYENSTTFSGGQLIVSQLFENQAFASTYGVESAVDWQISKDWKLRASHTWLKLNIGLTPDSTDTTVLASDGDIPRHQFQVRSYLDLHKDWALDTALFYVGGLDNASLPAVVRLDVRLAWRPMENMTLSLTGHNLLDRAHMEFSNLNSGTTNREVPRSILARLDWDF